MRSGDRPGLQNRRSLSRDSDDGFDSHSLPPILSSLGFARDFASGLALALTPAERLNFKTGGWQAILSLMGSTPIRFRQFVFGGLARRWDCVSMCGNQEFDRPSALGVSWPSLCNHHFYSVSTPWTAVCANERCYSKVLRPGSRKESKGRCDCGGASDRGSDESGDGGSRSDAQAFCATAGPRARLHRSRCDLRRTGKFWNGCSIAASRLICARETAP